MACAGLGYDVYDYTPSSEASYPFVFVGEAFKQNQHLQKDYLNGQVQLTVHVWHNDPRKKGTVYDMADDIENAVRKLYERNVQDVNTQILIDTSTSRELLHGIVEFVINY